MMEEEGMLTYINRVRQIAENLKLMDAKIDEAEVAMAVLNGLPSKYDHLIVALDAFGDDAKLTMEFTKKTACCRRNRGNQSAFCVRHQS
jgi:hypothetical protein